jgi:hypothetical protein
MKTTNKKPGEHREMSSQDNPTGQLKTDYPLSEKDEVKRAEEKMRKKRKLL